MPLAAKKSLPYSNNADGVGYECKDGRGPNGDRKENFDVTLAGKKWLEENVDAFRSPILLEFIQDATALVQIMKPLIVDFATNMEKEFGTSLKGFADEVTASESSFFVRFIHYFGNHEQKVGDEIASAHVDRSGFTLHLFESAPGLQCLTLSGSNKNSSREWIDMPVSEGSTVIIPAMQMQLRSKGEFKALCHRVVSTKETARTGRYSAVCFVQLKNTSKCDKDIQGRMQEKTAGFNYNMTHKEFEKLFKK